MTDINLNQLPIPDWGLVCPNCQYPLMGLPSHRCPECGRELIIPELVQSWTRLRPPRFTGNERPLPDFGLDCAHCDHPLAGASADQCPRCDAPFDLAALRPTRDWFPVDADLCRPLPVAGMHMLLVHEHVPHFEERENALRKVYGTPSITVSRIMVASEFYFEVLWLIEHARAEFDKARQAAEHDQWHCPHCGEDNPLHFEVCWNCETGRGAP